MGPGGDVELTERAGSAERRRGASLVAASEAPAGPLERVARVMRCPLGMNRHVIFSAIVLVASLFVGTALKAQAATTPGSPTASAAPSADDGSTDGGYWTAWSDAASH